MSKMYMDFAWECLRRNPDYIDEWSSNNEVFDKLSDDGALLYQQRMDLQAEKNWGLLKYVDPEQSDPSNVFWSAEVSKKSTQAIYSRTNDDTWRAIYNNPRINFKKLILLNDILCFKIYNEYDYFQFFIDRDDHSTQQSGISLCIPLSASPQDTYRCLNRISGIINNKHEIKKKKLNFQLLETIDNLKRGYSHKDIASGLFGKKLVESEWSADSWIRANVRYRIKKATALVQKEYMKYL